MADNPERAWELGHGKGRDTRFIKPWYGRQKNGGTQSSAAGRGGQGAQVIVRLTGRTKSPSSLRASLEYFTRTRPADEKALDGELHTGRIISGRPAVHRLADDWFLANHLHARQGGGSLTGGTESQALVLSMPAGTPDAAVRDAARAWAKEHLKGFDWMMVLHQDTASPHVHIVIRAVGHDGRRFTIPPMELLRWREGFAEELQERGVDAQATDWRHKKAQEKSGRERIL